MPRFADWPERLAAFLAERTHTPFQLGVNDCVTVAGDAVLRMTGRDPMAAFRGAYRTEQEAEAIMGAGGMEPVLSAAMEAFGAPRCPISFAQRGDWALLLIGNQLICGIVTGDRIAAPAAHGLVYVPPRCAVATWAI